MEMIMGWWFGQWRWGRGEEAVAASSEGANSDDEAEMQWPDTAEKHRYWKQNQAQKNAAVMYIVSTMLNDAKNLQAYLDK